MNNGALKKLGRIFFSLEMAVFLSIVFIVAMAYATFLPTTQMSWKYVYSSKWFEIIMWLLGLNLLGVLIRYKTYKKPPIFILHLSVLIILLGAAITRYFGYEGILYLRDGQTKSVIMVERSKSNPSDVYPKKLGFAVRLDKFVLKTYPGSMQPSSYDSYVTVIDGNKSFKFHIYMNHILVYKGYRFYQESYDPDGKGSILSVNHDPGIAVTYLGYFLMLMGFLWSMFYRKSRFRLTIRKLKESGLFSILLFVAFSANQAKAQVNAQFLHVYAQKSKKVADVWSRVLVQQGGRIEPMDTLDLELAYKICKTRKLYGMNYNQIIAGMIAYPEIFQNVPLIYVGHPAIRKLMGLKGKYATYNMFFDKNGNFKYLAQVDKAYQTPNKDRTTLDRAWIRLNDNVYVAYEVFSGTIFRMFPTPHSAAMNYRWFSVTDIEKSVKMGLLSPMAARVYFNLFDNLIQGIRTYDVPLEKKTLKGIYELQKTYSAKILPSPSRVKWEIIYNRLNVFPKLLLAYILLGFVAIILGFVEILKDKKYEKLETALVILGYLALLAHTLNMLLRWYVAGHAPWADAYESIIFIAWGAAFASLIFFRKSMLALGGGLFVAGMFMFVAHLNSISPQITNLVPVLKSYWLLVHVAVITSSYGFLGVGSMLGLLNLILFAINRYKNMKKQIKQLNDIIYIALYIGLALLSVGTFLGAVWANESWGRYWSWDPKETWSLIAMVVYALVIHSKMIPKMRGEFIFSLLSFLSFFFILMTYFGVNFYLAQGLHSYGRGVTEGYGWINIIFAGMAAWIAVVLVTLFMAVRQKILKKTEMIKDNSQNDYHPEYGKEK